MQSNTDSEKWHKSIQGIEAKQTDLSPGELQAFAALKALYENGNFEASESDSYVGTIKGGLAKHSNNRLLSVHLKNFVAICEKCFKPKPAPGLTPQVRTHQPPVVVEIANTPTPATTPPTFGGIPQADIYEWQKAIASIEEKQSELSSQELSAFETLKTNCNNGNFMLDDNIVNIQIIRNLQKRVTNRLLQVRLNKFIELCDKYFRAAASVIIPTTITASTFTPPVVAPTKKEEAIIMEKPVFISTTQPNSQRERINSVSPNGNNKKMILIIIVAIALIGSWQAYKNWDTAIKPLLEDLGLIHKIIPVTSITLDKSELQLMVGDTARITATVIPDNSNNKSVTWLSYNSNVATVDTTGLVTAIAQGKTGIAAFYSDSILDTCTVYVQQHLYVIATKTYSFGKYTGRLKNGIPEGDGKMTYNRRVQIAKHDTDNPPHYAETGDYFDGSWGNGDIVSGYLYGRNGSIKERILAPKRFNLYDISKD